MSEYWGARVTHVPSAVQHYLPTRYVPLPTNETFSFTREPGERADEIEVINQKIMNQHPEDIAVLADRWQNAHDLLASMKQQLLEQSTILYHEHWREARARDVFMEKGPGETLAYLDDWMTATLSNVEALRALVNVAIDSRERMEELWSDYQRDIMAARDLSTWDRVQEDLQIWQGWEFNINPMSHLPSFGRDTSEAKEQAAREAVNAVHERYKHEAQVLARDVATQYAEAFGKVSGGHGALFEPMNVVLNMPHEPITPPPATPSAVPPGAAPAPPPPPSAVPPVAPPVPAAPGAGFAPAALTTSPPAPGAPPGLSDAAPTPGAVPSPGAVPGAGGAPAPGAVPAPGGLVPPLLPRGAGAGAPAAPAATGPGRPASAAAPRPGAVPPGLPPGAPGRLNKGVLKGRGGAGLPPGTPPAPGRTLGRKQPGTPASPERQRSGQAGPAGNESAFAGPPPVTAPPVLNNPRPAKGRPGRRDDATPAARGPGQTDPPTPGRPGATAPPVLNAPTSGRVGPDPAVRGRPGQRSTGQPGAAGRRRRPDVEWVGTDAARAEAAEPVLDRPEPPLTGQAVSRLEEVPARLRRARAESQPAGPARTKPGTVPPELAARRGAAETPGSTDAGAAADDQRVVLDEDAFSVETPGGGVLGKQREDKSYRPEPPPALGGGG